MRFALLVIGLSGLAGCRCDSKPGSEVSPGVVLVDAVGQGPERVEVRRKRLDDKRGQFTVVSGSQLLFGPIDRVIGIVAAVPNRERPSHLVLEIDSGTAACRLWYRVIDLRGDKPLVTGDFGNCWRITGPPAEADGALRFQLFAERSGASVVEFSYRDGMVAEVPGSTRPAAPPVAATPGRPLKP